MCVARQSIVLSLVSEMTLGTLLPTALWPNNW